MVRGEGVVGAGEAGGPGCGGAGVDLSVGAVEGVVFVEPGRPGGGGPGFGIDGVLGVVLGVGVR